MRYAALVLLTAVLLGCTKPVTITTPQGREITVSKEGAEVKGKLVDVKTDSSGKVTSVAPASDPAPKKKKTKTPTP